MSLSTSRRGNKKRKSKRKLSPQEVFQKEWQRVQNLQKKNRNMAAEIDELVAKVTPQLEAVERELADALYYQTEKILVFLGRKSLPEWCKYELLDWLESNGSIMQNMPFAGHLDFEALYDSLAARVEGAFGGPPDSEVDQPESTMEPEDKNKSRASDKKDSPMDDMFEELFAEFENQDDSDDHIEDFQEDQENHWQEYFDRQEQAELQAEQDRNKQIDKLLRASNINKMFRKIARILHPDKEPDPEKKDLRHQQMSELLKARDEKDIAALFALYDQHIGTSPLEELGEDIESATKILQYQAQQLRNEQNSYTPKSIIEAYIFEHFYGKSPQALSAALRKHKARTKELAENQTAISRAMTSIKALKPLLEERRKSRFYMAYEDDLY